MPLLGCIFGRNYITKYYHTATFYFAPPGYHLCYSTLILSKHYRSIVTFGYTCLRTRGVIPAPRGYRIPPIMVSEPQYGTVADSSLPSGDASADKHSKTCAWIAHISTVCCRQYVQRLHLLRECYVFPILQAKLLLFDVSKTRCPWSAWTHTHTRPTSWILRCLPLSSRILYKFYDQHLSDIAPFK